MAREGRHRAAPGAPSAPAAARSRSASRDRPDASTVPSSSSTQKVIRRCAGRSSSDQSAAPMRTPRSRSIASASTSSSGPERGLTSASSAVAVSGIGTSGVRSRFGKRAQQRDDELRAKRGHEPLEVRLPHRPERRERDMDRDAVGRRAGVEAVGQRELQRSVGLIQRAGRSRSFGATSPSINMSIG